MLSSIHPGLFRALLFTFLCFHPLPATSSSTKSQSAILISIPSKASSSKKTRQPTQNAHPCCDHSSFSFVTLAKRLKAISVAPALSVSGRAAWETTIFFGKFLKLGDHIVGNLHFCFSGRVVLEALGASFVFVEVTHAASDGDRGCLRGRHVLVVSWIESWMGR